MAKNKLFYYRREKGLRQHELAERVGITELNVSRIETGRMIPDTELCGRISRALGVSPDDLFPQNFNQRARNRHQ